MNCFDLVVDTKPILSVLQLMLLEHIAMCRLVTGNKSLALQEISQAFNVCRQHPRLLDRHRPQLHTLLGLYAMNMNCMEAAELQFTAALNVSFCYYVLIILSLSLIIIVWRYLAIIREKTDLLVD